MLLSIEELLKQYPHNLRYFSSFILREYLQYHILNLLFTGNYAEKFSFLGGTCLRIIHQNQRFSEDLDFDNFDLSISDFDDVALNIKSGLENLGLQVEIENVYKGAYHCYIKFPGLLYQEGLTGHKEQKILIQLYTESQGFDYKPEIVFINKFDIFSSIFSTPANILLSQKLFAIFNRRQPKGRDFYDVIFLLGKGVQPNFDFLDQKIQISNPLDLKHRLIEHCNSLDFNFLSKDVQPFLFNSEDSKRVLHFLEFIKSSENKLFG